MREQLPPFVYRFGRCELQPLERCLLRDGAPVALTARAFDVLRVLVERSPQLVTKDELWQRVWPHRVVEENNLQQQVSALRRLLGSDAIVTVQGHGYRFGWRTQRSSAHEPATLPGRLPLPLTSFVGRERELAEVQPLLAGARMLTLVGMGGIGKTRLALQLAAAAAPDFADGTAFIDLSPLRDPALVTRQVALALGVREEPGLALADALAAFVQTRRLLIVLDNCEHLLSACARLADALLARASGLRVLATSREALHVPGEQLYRLLPMSVGNVDATWPPAEQDDAVHLFMDRVHLHSPGLTPDAQELRGLCALCVRLEGIPLALELAAARARTLSIAELNERLADRFRLLGDGSGLLAERQQTLRALLDWSWELLAPAEQLLCERSSVFCGGFDLVAAEAVCGHAPLVAAEVFERLSSLVDKSLVLVELRGAQGRYRMLETMREYAHEKLVARGGAEAGAAASRHCLHYLELAKVAARDSAGPRSDWAERIEADLDNLRAAVACALGGGVDAVVAVKLEVALLKFRLLRGHAGEGRRNIDVALAMPDVQASNVAHAHALYVGAGLAASQGEHAVAADLLEACLELRRAIGNRTDLAATWSTLALVRLQGGEPAGAREAEDQALALFRVLGDAVGEAISLLHLGQIEMHVEHHARAQARLVASLNIAQRIEHAETASECERLLGELALDGGDVEGARARFAASLAVCRRAGDRRGEALVLWQAARVDLDTGDAGDVGTRLRTALRAFRDYGLAAECVGCVESFAALAQRCGDTAAGVRLLAAASTARERLRLLRSPRAERALHQALAAARRVLGDEPFSAALRQGAEGALEGVMEALLQAQPAAPMPAGPARSLSQTPQRRSTPARRHRADTPSSRRTATRTSR